MKKNLLTKTICTIMALALLVAPVATSYNNAEYTRHISLKGNAVLADDVAGIITEETTHVEGLDDAVLAAVQEQGDAYADMQAYMVELINEKRAAVGLDPVVLDEDLCFSATYRSAHMCMNNYFSHYYNKVAQPGVIHQAVCGEKNYSCLGENIFRTRANVDVTTRFTNEELMERANNGFCNSPGHYKVMTKSQVTKVGIGIFFNEDKTHYYVTQIYSN